MNRELSSLICAFIASLCFIGNGSSAQAQAYGCYGTNVYPIYGMNPPTECDDCDYACAGYGHRGWYQRNFGSNYSFAGWCGNRFTVCGPCGCRQAGPCGHRVAHGSCYPALCAIHVPACCSPVPNCICAKSSGDLRAQPTTLKPVESTASFDPINNSMLLPTLFSNPVPLKDSPRPGV